MFVTKQIPVNRADVRRIERNLFVVKATNEALAKGMDRASAYQTAIRRADIRFGKGAK